MDQTVNVTHRQIGTLVDEVSVSLSRGLRQLLETKHLYQKINCELSEKGKNALRGTYCDEVMPLVEKNLIGTDLIRPIIQFRLGTIELPTFTAENCKLYCAICSTSEVFAPKAFLDISAPSAPISRFAASESMLPPGQQLFALTMQCQRCKQQLAGFLIKRVAWTLSIQGRYPFEHFEIPPYFPKEESEHYRNAMIGACAGQILAAKFSLRVFIEQFARRVTGITSRISGTDLLESYGQTLDPKLRDMMPSLKSVYERLSDAIHSARKDEKLFEEACGEIDRHFDMRRVFKIQTQTIATPSPQSDPA